MLAQDFRKVARDSLRGRWAMAVITGLVAMILGAVIFQNYSGEITSRINDWSDGRWTVSFSWLPWIFRSVIELWLAFIGLIFGILTIVRFVIGGATTLGYAAFNLDLVDGVDTSASVVFTQYYRLGAGFCMQLLRAIYVALWTLLFVIPGIVASYSYAMTPYILLENPGMGANEAIARSKDLMRGNRMRLFCLQFSFVGWYILSMFTLGIGLIWLRPYVEAAQAAFYREITGTRRF